MLTQSDTREGGNTKPSRDRCRKYIGVLNNYSDKEYEHIKVVTQKCERFIIGKEIGESGTPHLQMYIEFKNAIAFNTLKGWNERIHWEKAKGNVKDNYMYCSKDGDFIEKGMMNNQDRIIRNMKLEYKDVIWKDWQKLILNIIDKEGDERIINWVYDPKGNSGKSYLRRYIDLNYDSIICDGKKNDFLNLLKVKCIDNDENVKVILLDIPRYNKDYLNYGLLEQLLDRIVISGKYEGSKIYLDKIHIIVFSNDMPEKKYFTEDRWNVIPISDKFDESI